MSTLAARFSLPTAALVAASVITVTPMAVPPPALSAITPPTVHSLQMPEIQLTASAIDILRLPALRQWIVNRIDDIVTLGVGLLKSAEGIGKSILAFPEALVDVTKLLFGGDPVGALARAEEYLVGSIAIIGGPTLAAIIERRERNLQVAEAMQTAVPAALITLGVSLLDGFNQFALGVITGTQNLVDSLWPISIPGYIPGIIRAFVDGIGLSIKGLADGAQTIIDGTVEAQNIIADALKAGGTPPLPLAPTAKAGAFPLTDTSVPSTADTITVTLSTADVTEDSVEPAGSDDQNEAPLTPATGSTELDDEDADHTELISTGDDALSTDDETVESTDVTGDAAPTGSGDSDATPGDTEQNETDGADSEADAPPAAA